jgi:hypothetical protein
MEQRDPRTVQNNFKAYFKLNLLSLYTVLYVSELKSSYTMFDTLYVGHCPLCEVCLVYLTFQELAILPFSGDWLSLY